MHITDHMQDMERYRDFRPTGFDTRGLNADEMGEDGESRADWVVAPCSHTRDSGCLDESNWASQLKALGGESSDVEVHRFGHWGPGWFEIVLVRPESEAHRVATELACALADYPVLDDGDFSEREREAADETWRECYRAEDRVAYIREHRDQFEFNNLEEMMGCVRGRFFCGYAGELLS